ncbi:bifunctional phosphoglucose/phosphomannose isomerase [Pontibacter sp. 172403-2]|uniref:bifunctional phosphoglucose/phosphomannose isomerase n=1 Tax=Pontibacter rufus TaxID=2791028 RepID=UPI0018AFA5D8|nr:bifunctional phosphoglucose/phosphomannose isomerase [Pontibacter sp. 172403-2]MBF9252928.1 bifunctional phosphoglucose/phosphomannose isomerase [Pontibacter sp. 172403-2]
MKQFVEEFIQHLQQAIRLGERAAVTLSGTPYNNVVIAGMGSAGIAGDLVKAYVADKLAVPVIIHKGYHIPAFVGSDTLFIAASFSGITEETLAAVRAALKQEATVACITSGGELQRIALENNLPHLLIPGGPGQRRATLVYAAIEMLYLLHYAGLLDDTFKTELAQSITLLQEQTGGIKVQASALASAFQGKLPVLYASRTFKPVAVRLQQQLNQNARQLAHVNVFPEMNHNELEGWRNPEQLFGQLAVLLIYTSYDHPRVHLRMELSTPVFKQRVGDVMTIEAAGATFLEQAFYLVHLFDWVSVYLAELNGVDSETNNTINNLKDKLSKA